MQVTIHYCELCRLRRPAEQIAEALRREFGLDCQLREAFWGTFRIECGDREIFNRWKHRGLLGRLGCGRTPTPDEIVNLFRTRELAVEGSAD